MNDAIAVDWALIAWYVFLGLFVTLVLYLRREDRREGYPLESDSGRLQSAGGVLYDAHPKIFHLPHGRGTYAAPHKNRDRRVLSARRTSVVPGSPITPVGDPMLAGVGPGAHAERANFPELTALGEPKVMPMRAAADFHVAKQDKDPRGLRVVGTDLETAGIVTDLWVDRAEAMVRYFEVTLTGGGTVLAPITMSVIDHRRGHVRVDAITAAQFANVPRIANPDQVTLHEEDKICGYYGGGYLYATPGRMGPLL